MTNQQAHDICITVFWCVICVLAGFATGLTIALYCE